MLLARMLLGASLKIVSESGGAGGEDLVLVGELEGLHFGGAGVGVGFVLDEIPIFVAGEVLVDGVPSRVVFGVAHFYFINFWLVVILGEIGEGRVPGFEVLLDALVVVSVVEVGEGGADSGLHVDVLFLFDFDDIAVNLEGVQNFIHFD